ncbi:hypothetical protein [Enterovibrio norvegicus]|uniref:hypothetical protein n=1 Tax=Enterovibrio norvegicus TaxID=188144 RepID=UPI000C82FE70|nr:hypothetical protein [Enterovibrio norvegicus]PMH69092.1 hypothetical protein BCU62_25355 [Enterovibrio norvegicus]
MKEQQTKSLKSAIDGLLWLSAESIGQRFHIDVLVLASRQELEVKIVDLTLGESPIYLDSSHGQPFSRETINTMEDRLIEKLADLNQEQEIAA